MPSRHDPIEELTALAEFHDKINRIHVFVSLLEAHNIRVLRQMPHDVDLAAHVLDVNICPELALGYDLASQGLACLEVKAFVGDPKLTAPEFFPELVFLEDVIAGRVVDDRKEEGGRRTLLARRVEVVVEDGFQAPVVPLPETRFRRH